MSDLTTGEGKEPEAQGSELVRVKFLRVHPDYGYFAGDIGVMSPLAAETLSQSKSKIQKGILVIEEPFVFILPEGWIEELPVIETSPEPVFVDVKFLEPHPSYGYFPGQKGVIPSIDVEKLLQGGYIEVIKKDDGPNIGPNKGVFTRVKDYFKNENR